MSEFFDRRGRRNQKKTDRTTGILYDPLLLLDMFSYLRTQNPSEAGKRLSSKEQKSPFTHMGKGILVMQKEAKRKPLLQDDAIS